VLILPDELLIAAQRLVRAERLPLDVRLRQAHMQKQHHNDSVKSHRISTQNDHCLPIAGILARLPDCIKMT
jgi:hypothetical protein